MMRKNNQHQAFRPLVNRTVDYFLTDHVPAAVQNLYQIVNVRDLRPTQIEQSTGFRSAELVGQFGCSMKSGTFCLQERNRLF